MSQEDFDIHRLAEYLHMMPSAVIKLAERGKLPGRRVGGDWRFAAAEIHHVEIADANHIVLKLKNPDPTIIPALAVFNTAIMPKALYEAEPGATDAEKAESFAKHPVGTGPFVFESWERGSKLRIVRNPHHWERGEDGQPLPYLDAVVFEIIPDDATRTQIVRDGKTRVLTFSKICLTQQGAPGRVELLKSSGYPAYDQKVLAKMRAWRFRPFLVNGAPTVVCSTHAVIYTQSN